MRSPRDVLPSALGSRTSPSATPFLRRAPTGRVPYQRWIKLGGPLAVASVVTVFGPWLDKPIAAAAGALILVALRRYPGAALRWLGVILPYQLLALAGLYAAGAPIQLVRGLNYTKDVLIAAIAVAAITTARRERHRLDLLDKLALGYVGLGVAYLLLPGVFVNGAGASIPLGVRFNGFRSDVMYVVLLVAARHARIPAAEVARAARWFVTGALVAAGLAIYEFFLDGSWNRFVTETLELPRYRIELQKAVPGRTPQLFDIRAYTSVGGRRLLRIGGVLVSYLSFGFYLVIAVALSLERHVRQLARPARAFGIALLGVAILFTETRAAVVGFVLVLLLGLRQQRGRRRAARVRGSLLVGALLAVVLPIVLAIGLADRFGGNDDKSSNARHSELSHAGISALTDEPLGRGLATAAGVAQTENPQTALVTENQLLQIGVQLGVIGLALWIGVYAATVRTLRRAVDIPPRSGEDDAAARAVAAAMAVVLLGLAPSMLFLQIHIYPAFAWMVWAFAGAALGSIETRSPTPPVGAISARGIVRVAS